MKKLILTIGVALVATVTNAQLVIVTNTPAPVVMVKDAVLQPAQLDAYAAMLGVTNISSSTLEQIRITRRSTRSNDVFVVHTELK